MAQMDGTLGGRIYVIVAVFNRRSLTRQFLQGLRRQNFQTFTTIVVDDGSTDGTAEMVEKCFPEVQLLRGNGELWWTGATNLGIQHAIRQSTTHDAVLVINDDIEVGPEYLGVLHQMHTSFPKALIGSVVVDSGNPDVIVDGGRTINWWTARCRTLNVGKHLSHFSRQYCVDVSVLTGWGTLIPFSVFREVGLFDDKHFQQCGDTELPVRAARAGHRLLVSYAAIAKVQLAATDEMNCQTRYRLRDARRYFFDVKSNFRLKYRWFFSLNTAKHPLGFASYLMCDLLRITYHFISRLRLWNGALLTG